MWHSFVALCIMLVSIFSVNGHELVFFTLDYTQNKKLPEQLLDVVKVVTCVTQTTNMI